MPQAFEALNRLLISSPIRTIGLNKNHRPETHALSPRCGEGTGVRGERAAKTPVHTIKILELNLQEPPPQRHPMVHPMILLP
jgi:hypothetical protein